jgi:hypothetical protein
MENSVTEDKLSFDELIKITSQVRDEKKNKNNERIRKGLIEAVNHITNGSYEKMTLSASKGYDRTLLYTATWTKDRDALYDNDGNKKMFGENVRLFDLIDKGHNEFKTELENFFNKDSNSKYNCFFKKKYNYDGSFRCYSIFVSWGTPETKKNPLKKQNNLNDSTTKNSKGGKGFAPVKISKNQI